MNRASSLHLSWLGGLLYLAAWGVSGCDGGSEDNNRGGSSSMGGSTKGGTGGASGSTTGGSSGAPTSGASTGGAGGAGDTSKGGTGGSLGGTNGGGGSSGSATTFIGGCPDPNVCPDQPEDGQACPTAMTCCTYQVVGAEVVSCICADGAWDCRDKGCSCI